MTTRTTSPAPAVSDTQSMPIVEVPAARLAYTPNVIALFRAKVEEAVASVETWAAQQHDAADTTAKQQHDQIDAHAKDAIAQLRQALADVELNAPLRVGSGPAGEHPYASEGADDSTEGAAS